jgi:hypothetical protein
MVVGFTTTYTSSAYHPQAFVSFNKYMPPSLPYFKVNICPFPLLHFASVSWIGNKLYHLSTSSPYNNVIHINMKMTASYIYNKCIHTEEGRGLSANV